MSRTQGGPERGSRIGTQAAAPETAVQGEAGPTPVMQGSELLGPCPALADISAQSQSSMVHSAKDPMRKNEPTAREKMEGSASHVHPTGTAHMHAETHLRECDDRSWIRPLAMRLPTPHHQGPSASRPRLSTPAPRLPPKRAPAGAHPPRRASIGQECGGAAGRGGVSSPGSP